MIEYTSKNGWKGVLYGRHIGVSGKERYQMSIYDPNRNEVIHAYDALPGTQDQLKEVVDYAETHAHTLIEFMRIKGTKQRKDE